MAGYSLDLCSTRMGARRLDGRRALLLFYRITMGIPVGGGGIDEVGGDGRGWL